MTELLVQPQIDPVRQAQEALEAWAQNNLGDEPFSKLIGMITVGSYLFYKAEQGHNPKVKSIWDAMIYVSTCASVGYSDIFAQTPLGKMIGTFLMTVGPSMATAALSGGTLARQRERAGGEAVQQEILSTMKQILAELQKQNSAR